MNKSAVGLTVPMLAWVALTALAGTDVTGAGATLPYPVYAAWSAAYYERTGIRVNYQPIGSGAGIKQIEVPTVTFGATDRPLKPAELEANGLVQWPMLIGGVVPVVNLRGLRPGALVLDGATLAAIYLGEVKQWNDPRIARLNPGLKLPAVPIAPVYRADGSGTSFLFSKYLSAVSPAFKAEVGASTAVAWPVGLGAKGNEGVANMTARTAGAIGYVEYAFAKQNKMTYAALLNKAGAAVVPKIETFQSAADHANWAAAEGFYAVLVDQPGAASWPITGASFILMRRRARDPEKARTALEFFAWAYAEGDSMAVKLGYVPLPDKVVQAVAQTWPHMINVGNRAASN